MLFPCALPFSSSSPKVSILEPVSATGEEAFRCWGVGVVAQGGVGSLSWGSKPKQDQGQEVGGAGEEGEWTGVQVGGKSMGRWVPALIHGCIVERTQKVPQSPLTQGVNKGTGHSLAGVRKHRRTSGFPGAHWCSPPGSFLGCSGHTLSPGKNFQDIVNEMSLGVGSSWAEMSSAVFCARLVRCL